MIFNEVLGFRVPRVKIGKVFREFLRVEVGRVSVPGLSRGGFCVNLVFVGIGEMTKLNEKWKGGKGPTDVLSFNYGEGEVSGEIYICPKVAEENARMEGGSATDEVLLLFVHGLLHLVGYTHENDKKYENMMEKAMEILGIL